MHNFSRKINAKFTFCSTFKLHPCLTQKNKDMSVCGKLEVRTYRNVEQVNATCLSSRATGCLVLEKIVKGILSHTRKHTVM